MLATLTRIFPHRKTFPFPVYIILYITIIVHNYRSPKYNIKYMSFKIFTVYLNIYWDLSIFFIMLSNVAWHCTHNSGNHDMIISPCVLCCLQVQKEKLHAELKQVLSKKRSHLRESTCQLAQPEMDSELTDEQPVSRNLINTVNVAFQADILIASPSVVGHWLEIPYCITDLKVDGWQVTPIVYWFTSSFLSCLQLISFDQSLEK